MKERDIKYYKIYYKVGIKYTNTLTNSTVQETFFVLYLTLAKRHSETLVTLECEKPLQSYEHLSHSLVA